MDAAALLNATKWSTREEDVDLDETLNKTVLAGESANSTARPRRRSRLPMPSARAVKIVAALVVVYYFLLVPLPDDFAQKELMQVIDAGLRIMYHRPTRFIWLLGFGPVHQVYWTRYVLDNLAVLLQPWTRYDPHLKIEDITLSNVGVRVYEPLDDYRLGDGAVVFVHGGGFVIGQVDGYESLVREFARRLGVVTFSVDYRLAPEHVYPAAIDDVEAAVLALLTHAHRVYDIDPHKIVVMGDSAGGNLVAAMTQRLRDMSDEHERLRVVRPLPRLAAQVLLYPLVQYHDMQLPSYQLYWDVYSETSFLDPEAVARAILMYTGAEATQKAVGAMVNNNHTGRAVLLRNSDRLSHDHLPEQFRRHSGYESTRHLESEHQDYESHPRLASHLHNADTAPLLADNLEGLPPAFLATCQYDILRDEGYLYGRALREAGIGVEYKHYSTGFHAMLNLWHRVDAAMELIDDAVRFTKRHVY